MVKKEEDMRVILSRDVLKDNIARCLELANSKGVDLSFMVKRQFLKDDFIRKELLNYRTYTTKNIDGFLNYKDFVVADILEKREGESKEYFESHNGNGKIVIMNCYCATNILPSEENLEDAVAYLHEKGYKVSAGGTVIGFYENKDYDEIRIGEGLLTGYSTVKKESFYGCKNPYSIEIDIAKEQDDFLLAEHGFLELGGFTDTKPMFINTDLSGFEKSTQKDGKIVVRPDYYTLIKLYDRGVDVEYK